MNTSVYMYCWKAHDGHGKNYLFCNGIDGTALVGGRRRSSSFLPGLRQEDQLLPEREGKLFVAPPHWGGFVTKFGPEGFGPSKGRASFLLLSASDIDEVLSYHEN